MSMDILSVQTPTKLPRLTRLPSAKDGQKLGNLGVETFLTMFQVPPSKEVCSCTYCQAKFVAAKKAKRQYCSLTCKMREQRKNPESLQKWRESMKEVWDRDSPTKGIPRPDTAERMRLNNPMKNPETVQKVVDTLRAIGHKPSVRGGNGHGVTAPQKLLLDAFPEAVAEYAINTAPVREHYEVIAKAYKVDLAFLREKVAVEVDGSSHKVLVRQEQDRRKCTILASLGWSVLRFTNREVLDNPQAVVEKIRQSMI